MLLTRSALALFGAALLFSTLQCSRCVECIDHDELATCTNCTVAGSRAFCDRSKGWEDRRCEYLLVPQAADLAVRIDLSTEPDFDELVIETRVEGSLDGVMPTLNGSPIASCSPQPPNRILCHPLPSAPFTMVLRNDQRAIEKISVKSRLHSCGDTIRSCPL